MKTLFAILLAAFLVQMTNGEKIIVRDAIGFVLVEVQDIPCHGFFDKAGDPVAAIPSALIAGVEYRADDKVM